MNAIAPLVLIVVSAGIAGALGVRRNAIDDGPSRAQAEAHIHRIARRDRLMHGRPDPDVSVRVDVRRR